MKKTWSFHIPLLGWAVTWYALNCAMHGAINISTPWGYLCARRTVGEWRWYVYLSPNATPWAATFTMGPGIDRDDRRRAPILRAMWGHGYDCTRLDPQIFDAALWAVESRHESAVQVLDRLIRDRSDWLKASA